MMDAVLDAAAPPPARVLIVDDDPNVADVLARYLAREGYVVMTEADGRAGLRRALRDQPDLVILDVMLPGLDGLDVCRRLRAAASMPVIMLTARRDESDLVCGLEVGADDYVAKPFSPREVVARAKAVLRRAKVPSTGDGGHDVLTAGAVVVDLVSREVRRDGKLVTVTVKEFDLLAHLMRNAHVALRREDLFAEVWGFRFGDTSTVTVHVRRLREKIEPDPSDPRHIRTVWGVGYRFEP
jgi:two-component system response regulator ResD